MEHPTGPIHDRQIRGVQSRILTHWHERPLRGLYFVESTLSGGAGEATRGNAPAVLVPGAIDPRDGEFSERLIRSLLEDGNTPSVLEAHYCFESRSGYIEPDAIVEDLKILYNDGSHGPVIIGLCGGTLLILLAMWAAAGDAVAPQKAQTLIVGPYLPAYTNKFGKVLEAAIGKIKMAPGSMHLKYAGHRNTTRNLECLKTHYASSALGRALAGIDPKSRTNQPFPIPLDALYFKFDVATREGRARMRRLFDVPHSNDRIGGIHRDLRDAPDADAAILAFYEGRRSPTASEVGPSAAMQATGASR